MSESPPGDPACGDNGQGHEGSFFNWGLTALGRERDRNTAADNPWPPFPVNTPSARTTYHPDVAGQDPWLAPPPPSAGYVTRRSDSSIAQPVPRLQPWTANALPGSALGFPAGQMLHSSAPGTMTNSQTLGKRSKAAIEASVATYGAFLQEEQKKHLGPDSVARCREDLNKTRKEFRSLSTFLQARLHHVRQETVEVMDRMKTIQAANSAPDAVSNDEAPPEGGEAPHIGDEELSNLLDEADRFTRGCDRLLRAAAFDETGPSSEVMEVDGY